MGLFRQLENELNQRDKDKAFDVVAFDVAVNHAIDDHINMRDTTQALEHLTALWPEEKRMNAFTTERLFGDYCIYKPIDGALQIKQLI